MNAQCKYILKKLLDGGNISGNQNYGYRLRDAKHAVLLRFSYRTLHQIKDLLRKQKGVWLINKNKVRSLHGNSMAKKLYKKSFKSAGPCEPCTFEIPGRKKKKSAVIENTIPENQLQIF